MIKLYGIPNWQQIRKTRAVFEANAIDYEFINLKKTPVSEDFLRDVVHQLGLDVVVNSKGATYRKLKLKEKNLNDDELFQVLLQEQGMIKRPLIEKDGRFWIGFDEPGILSFIGA